MTTIINAVATIVGALFWPVILMLLYKVNKDQKALARGIQPQPWFSGEIKELLMTKIAPSRRDLAFLAAGVAVGMGLAVGVAPSLVAARAWEVKEFGFRHECLVRINRITGERVLVTQGRSCGASLNGEAVAQP